MRTRPRRLLLVAAASALCVGLFFAMLAPLRAQAPPRVVFKLPDGSNPYVRGDQISAAGEQRTFIIGADRKRTSVASVTLSQLIDLSGGNFDGIGVYRLGRDGAPVYVDESEPVYFYVEDGVVKWVITDGTDSNRVAEGNFGEGERIQLNGFEGEHAGVEIAVTPDTIRAGVEATFTATTSGGEDGEEFHYKWTLDGVAQDESNATFKKTFKKKASHVVGVEAIGSTGSRGYAEVGVNVARAPKQPQQNGGGGNGGTTTPGGGGGGGGGSTPGPAAPVVPPSAPSTPPLAPPSTSPPPSNPGRGPNLDPSAPSTSAPVPDRIEGILVSTSVPAKPGQNRSGQAAQANQRQAANKNSGVDWTLAGGISLTALLVILGAVRERAHIQRLLPQPQ